MGIRNLTSLDTCNDFNLQEETLSDNSKVYSIWVMSEGAGAEIHCTSFQAAEELFRLLSDRNKYYL